MPYSQSIFYFFWDKRCPMSFLAKFYRTRFSGFGVKRLQTDKQRFFRTNHICIDIFYFNELFPFQYGFNLGQRTFNCWCYYLEIKHPAECKCTNGSFVNADLCGHRIFQACTTLLNMHLTLI